MLLLIFNDRMYSMGIKRPFSVRFDPYTNSIEVLDNPLKIRGGLEMVKEELKVLADALNILAWVYRFMPPAALILSVYYVAFSLCCVSCIFLLQLKWLLLKSSMATKWPHAGICFQRPHWITLWLSFLCQRRRLSYSIIIETKSYLSEIKHYYLGNAKLSLYMHKD